MKRFFNIFAIALASVLMFSCQEDADVDNFDLGGTVRGKFSLVVPSNELVEITRATEAEESDITEVYLFYFDADYNALNCVGGKNYELVTLGTPTQSGNYTRTYTVGTAAEFEKGQVVNVYAIANPSSSLGALDAFTEVNNYEGFSELLMNLNTLNTPFSTMTMSGKLQGTASEQYGLTGTIEVKRPYAKVNFTIKSGSSNFTFTPTQYNVKNVPANGAVFEGVEVSGITYTDHVGMTDFIESQGSQLIEFYMLENKAGNAAGVANYNDRELRKDVTGGDHAEFAHGLKNATYVEILGEGKGTNNNGEPISATVKYTIHLGDFATDATDFNVNRNHFYNYTVTVNGVNNIVVEAESGKMDDESFQHGAEGTVINLEGSKMVYTLDAHYEQVLLNLDLTALPTDGDDVVMVVSTPFMTEANKGKMITWNMIEAADFGQNFDTEWVEFWAGENKTGQSTLCAYPSGNANLMKTVDFLKWVKQQAANGVTNLSVVAFINEYFYNDNPITGEKNIHWSQFVNKEDRTMRILQEPRVSADGYSISTKALCSFTQRSIRTFFNENTEGAYGIEWYEETGTTNSTTNGTNDDNGLANLNGRTLTNRVNFNYVGYGTDGQPNGNTYSSSALSNTNAIYACLTRNRSVNDVKWYLAAPNQFVAYWYGEASIPNEARLYKGNPAENFTGNYDQMSHHWTSGTSSNAVFWPMEGATLSVASSWGWTAGSGNHHVRCMRNLDSNTAIAKAAELDSKELAVVFKNFNDNAYRGIATENLPVHHERDAANKLPKAIFIASSDHTATWTAMTDAPAAPQILSAEVMDGKLVVKFLEKDTYSVATSATGSKTDIILGAENSYEISISNTSTTYHFFTKRNYNTYSQYVTVTATGTINNTPRGTGGSYDISGGTSNNRIPLMAAIHQDLCKDYKEGDVATRWRVPTQRELLAMYILRAEINGRLTNDIQNNTLSSTLFSARNVASTSDIRYGFVWYYTNTTGFGLQSYNWGNGSGTYRPNGRIRCVRDASEAELQQLGISNGGDQESGGEG